MLFYLDVMGPACQEPRTKSRLPGDDAFCVEEGRVASRKIMEHLQLKENRYRAHGRKQTTRTALSKQRGTRLFLRPDRARRSTRRGEWSSWGMRSGRDQAACSGSKHAQQRSQRDNP